VDNPTLRDGLPLPQTGDKEEPACLVLHGLGGGPYELAPLIKALEDSGLRVLAPILPGHDGPGPAMPGSSWREWVSATESAFDEIATAGTPVSVIGFSTGAMLALHLATRRPIERLVLLAPFLAIRYTGWLPFHPATVLRPLARVVPHLPRRRPAVRDPEMRWWAATKDRFTSFSMAATLSALELIDMVKPLVAKISAPALIIQGERDTVVEPAGATWLHENLGSTNKTLIRLAESDHLLALDYEREQVVELTKDFILGREDRGDGFTSRTESSHRRRV
jgi:carboxylesterase